MKEEKEEGICRRLHSGNRRNERKESVNTEHHFNVRHGWQSIIGLRETKKKFSYCKDSETIRQETKKSTFQPISFFCVKKVN
jgi:hypothetical protein